MPVRGGCEQLQQRSMVSQRRPGGSVPSSPGSFCHLSSSASALWLLLRAAGSSATGFCLAALLTSRAAEGEAAQTLLCCMLLGVAAIPSAQLSRKSGE